MIWRRRRHDWGREHRRPIRAFVVAVAAIGVIASACTPAGPDEFYAASATLSVGQPGDLIRFRESTFSLDPMTGNQVGGVHSWQVIYRSTTSMGAPVDVSGTVLVPTKPWRGKGPRPVVGYGVGTRGVGDHCAPSKTLATGWDYEGSIVLRALQEGWAVVVTDMIGLGTDGMHTYGVGRDQGQALLDVVRAALALDAAELNADAPVGLMGYSQGGGTVAWAASLAADYAPELNLVGTAAGGVPSDLGAVARRANGGLFFGLLMMAAVGYDAAYPELDLQGYLNSHGEEFLAQADELCIVDPLGFQLFARAAFTWIGGYVAGKNPLDSPAWQRRLEQNKLDAHVPETPVLLQHAVHDQIMPERTARELRDAWCEAGASVDYVAHQLAEHALGILFSLKPAFEFLDARFKGRTPADELPDERLSPSGDRPASAGPRDTVSPEIDERSADE